MICLASFERLSMSLPSVEPNFVGWAGRSLGACLCDCPVAHAEVGSHVQRISDARERMIHVVGYALAVSSPDNGWRSSSVLLIEKTHPTWQAGRLNGLGGKVESGEIPADAMAREFKQETCGRLVGSRLYRREGWRHFATLAGADWQCAFFVGFLNGIDVTAMHGRMSDEGERLVETSLQDVHPANGRILQSCLWLIPMATQLDAYAPGSLPIVISEAAPGALRKAQRDRRSLIR